MIILKLIITEKPSVAREFAKALKLNTVNKGSFMESGEWIITWCVGHLVTMSYPEKYDENLKNFLEYVIHWRRPEEFIQNELNENNDFDKKNPSITRSY